MKPRELFVNLLKVCNDTRSLYQLHSRLIKSGFARDSFFATKLIALYAGHSNLGDARKVFDETPCKIVYLYNAILRGYCREKKWEDTLFLFSRMVSVGFTVKEKPDTFTFPLALKACEGLRAFRYGEVVHGFMIKNVCIASNVFVGSALMEFYSKCGQMACAFRVFKGFSEPDVFMWTSMVTGYEQNGFPEEAVEFFHQMVMIENVRPDLVTLVSLVSACAQLLNLKLGQCLHSYVIRVGFHSDLSLVNSLLNLYAKTACVENAVNLFNTMPEKDVISWSSMVSCYSQNGFAVEAINIFNEMIEMRVEPNSVTVVSALQACAISCDLEEGRKIHKFAAERGLELEVSVATALFGMYMKCLSLDEAVDVFRTMPEKDVVSWAALIGGYLLNGLAGKSIKVFRDMLSSEIKPDAVSIVKILSSCSELGVLQQAFCLHCYVIRSGFDTNNFIQASLIEMYSKCGSLENAVNIFEGITNKDIVIWSTMIAGYGINGQGREALKIFNQMVKSSIKPNSVTFLSILSACSHSGLVKEGIKIFDMMVNEYRLNLDSEHYAIVVDLLGRSGEIKKAMDVIDQMPTPAGPHVWGALLGACRIHHDIEIGELAAEKLFRLDPDHAGYYILLSNMYAQDDRWRNVAKLRDKVKEKGLKKSFGQSAIEVRNEVHGFVADDRLHPECENIYELLQQLEVKMREEGYAPDTGIVFHRDAETVL